MSTNLTKNEIVEISFEILIKAVLLGIIVYYAFSILKPFLIPVLWGVIIAVALAPLISKIEKYFVGKRVIIVALFTALAISAILIPTYALSDSVIKSSTNLARELHEGTLKVPPPTQNVKEWPLVGEKAYSLWSSAADNLENTLMTFKPQVKEYAPKIVSMLTGALGGLLGFVLSLVIAAIFLVKADGAVKAYHGVSRRLIGEKGVEWATLSALTIRSVAQGVLGIAIFQGVLALIGMLLIDVPFAWVWAFLVMFLTIIQLPALIVLGPVIAYVFSYADATPATVFAIYAVIVGASDGFLKPLVLGRGVDVPMLVILLGAIGGMMLSGLLGLFVGAVGLALAYKLFLAWLEDKGEKGTEKE